MLPRPKPHPTPKPPLRGSAPMECGSHASASYTPFSKEMAYTALEVVLFSYALDVF